MQIPLSFADAVIGASGANISYIRRASGASITIQETRGVPGEMTVEISGTASQIQAAQQLVQVFDFEAALKFMIWLLSVLSLLINRHRHWLMLILHFWFIIKHEFRHGHGAWHDTDTPPTPVMSKNIGH